MEACIDQLNGKSIFTSIDLMSGFWQNPATEAAQEKLAFSCPYGQYTWSVMPFGIKTAPACFQRLMDKILRDEIGQELQVYLDDILVATDTWTQHWDKLEKLLEKLEHSNLKLQEDKMKIGSRKFKKFNL